MVPREVPRRFHVDAFREITEAAKRCSTASPLNNDQFRADAGAHEIVRCTAPIAPSKN